jgi:hypothetical protein
MKNLFKKAAKNNVTANVQKLDKTQLEKVIGGLDSFVNNTTTDRSINESGISASPTPKKGK